MPSSGNDRSVSYRVVNIFDGGGLWARRANPETFASFGAVRCDNGQDNATNAPWGWDDHDDGDALLGGEFATDPGKLISIYFSNIGSFSRAYLRNGYQSGPTADPGPLQRVWPVLPLMHDPDPDLGLVAMRAGVPPSPSWR